MQDAEALFANERFGAAYYLAGYAVECALKACIAKRTREFEFPDKLRANQSHTHDLLRLLDLSGLEEFKAESRVDRFFEYNWKIIRDWSEDARYESAFSHRRMSLDKRRSGPALGLLSDLVLAGRNCFVFASLRVSSV
ncbi:MAG: hypothetical protein ACR2NN_13030, partial [Bryobacteraceae bacterium]